MSEIVSELVCPHCLGTAPRGASVCRGCQAEIEYGPPRNAYLAIIIGGVIAGFWTGSSVPRDLSFLAWVVAFGVIIGGSILIYETMKDRVIFKREYRTRR